MNRPPIIGYDNLLTIGTTTGDGTDPENAYDWRTDDAWTTGAASGYLESDPGGTYTVDYFAIVGHTLATRSATAKLQYWTGAAYADIPYATVTPATDDALMVLFPGKSATKFKFVVTTDGTAATLAVVSFGQALALPQGLGSGYVAPRFARDDVLYTNISQGGHFIGRRLVSSGVSGSLALANLESDWIRGTVDEFVIATRTQGWFLMWNPDQRPNEAAYCWATETPKPAEEIGGRATLTISYRGVTS